MALSAQNTNQENIVCVGRVIKIAKYCNYIFLYVTNFAKDGQKRRKLNFTQHFSIFIKIGGCWAPRCYL
jgi:hypothetical protein